MYKRSFELDKIDVKSLRRNYTLSGDIDKVNNNTYRELLRSPPPQVRKLKISDSGTVSEVSTDEVYENNDRIFQSTKWPKLQERCKKWLHVAK